MRTICTKEIFEICLQFQFLVSKMESLLLRAMMSEGGPSRNSDTSMGVPILRMLKKASHPSAMQMTTDMRIQAMCETQHFKSEHRDDRRLR